LSIDVVAIITPFQYAEWHFTIIRAGSGGNKGRDGSDIPPPLATGQATRYNRPMALHWPTTLLAALLAATPVDLGTPAPRLTRLFTPPAAPPGRYLVYRSRERLETLVSRLRALDPAPAPGAWEPTRPEAVGAFGQEGVYDRGRLARLFTGQRVTVVRGSLVTAGQRRAYTLISPHPDETLSVIVDGTMVIEVRVPPTLFDR
jgi:hypothetical protein